jgi:uncharacterized protein YqgV (UPF0045/DUF77 family)
MQAEVSLYPMKTDNIRTPIEDFVRELEARGLQTRSGPMSTSVRGECAALFAALGHSLEAIARHEQVVLVAKVSNTCPDDDK